MTYTIKTSAKPNVWFITEDIDKALDIMHTLQVENPNCPIERQSYGDAGDLQTVTTFINGKIVYDN